MKFSRGLAALILILITIFQTTLSAEYLYKDEVINNPSFTQEVEKLGAELYQKTGISLRLLMLRELPNKQSIVEYEKELIKSFSEPTILLTFSELDSKVDILASEPSLYEYFDKKQVLSPVASPVQAFLMALFYSDGFESFKEIASSSGGTILPLLAQKAKDNQQLGKYSGSMYNGYVDIAEQVAEYKNVVLDNAAGNANKNSILIVKLLFYGMIIYGIFLYIKRKIYIRRQNSEAK
ncbi:3-dehydroquinate dehydratase [bacterium]|nr:3-dehydroquinate dehydratase [bacterium]MBU1989499.1 3-dehydroquinate dehydratase [bacterium]